jgi:hypothetical protein
MHHPEAVTVRNRLGDLLQDTQALVEGQVRLMPSEGVQRQRALEGLDE